MKKKSTSLAIPLFAILLASLASCSESQQAELIQDCPEEKIVNLMPTVGEAGDSAEPNAYFIYKGERRELSEFDLDWVEANCDVTVTEVH